MKFHALTLALALASYIDAHAASVSAPSTQWTALQGNYDFLGDQQTGQPAGDIVGVGTNYGLFLTHNNNGPASNTDGTFGFRLRLDARDSNATPSQFQRAAWLGIDADFNDTIDVFIGVNLSGNQNSLGIFAPGTGANNSPSTTTISSTASKAYAIGTSSFNYRPVNFPTDGGTTNDVNSAVSKPEPDYYVSVMVDFADIVSFLSTRGILINDSSPLRFIATTSTQGNSFNQDIGGVDGGLNSTVLWSQTGAYTAFVTANGIITIPEPEPALLLLFGLVAGLFFRTRSGTIPV
jgi:hypothetical protein